jgi:hypothetical protein
MKLESGATCGESDPGLCYVGSLWSFGSLDNFKFHGIALLKGAVALAGNGGIVHEHIRAVISTDKSVAFGIVEPLDRSLHAHVLLARFKCFVFDANISFCRLGS